MLTDWMAAAKRVCEQSATSFAAQFESAQHRFYCFEAVYAVAVLHKGYGLPLSAAAVRFVDRIGGVDTSWTLGAMQAEAERVLLSTK